MAVVNRTPRGGTQQDLIVDADPAAGAGTAAPVGSTAVGDGTTLDGQWFKFGAANTDWMRVTGTQVIADPGDGLAIPVTASGSCSLTSAGAETRTLAIPTFEGQTLDLTCTVYVGNIVITVASAFDAAGNTTITIPAAGRGVYLLAITVGGVLRWLNLVNNGCNLT